MVNCLVNCEYRMCVYVCVCVCMCMSEPKINPYHATGAQTSSKMIGIRL